MQALTAGSRLSSGLAAPASAPDLAARAQALQYFKDGRPLDAIAFCYQHLAEAPDDIGVLRLLGEVLRNQGSPPSPHCSSSRR